MFLVIVIAVATSIPGHECHKSESGWLASIRLLRMGNIVPKADLQWERSADGWSFAWSAGGNMVSRQWERCFLAGGKEFPVRHRI